MAWWDGTFDTTDEEIEEAYPVRITEELRTSKNDGRMALINRYPKGDPLYTLSDPHPETDSEKPTVFFHVFFDDDKPKAQKAIFRFIATAHRNTDSELCLFRREEGRVFAYGRGEIRVETSGEQKALAGLLPEDKRKRPAFVVPPVMFRYPCPVCGHSRTLLWLGWYEICGECGREDDVTDDENEETLPNGEHTIRSYRRVYLRRKNKDPVYNRLYSAEGS